MAKNNETEEYSIATLLQRLADDELERKMIELLSTNLTEEQMLKELLKFIGRKH
jgi:hypothetical protein